jgi:LPXTG-motif cell wall-anchored protein
VTVIPAIVQEWVSGRTTEEIASVEISFNGETYLPIAMEKPTELTIPVTATEATLRVTTAAGEKVEIDKTLQRTGETVEATTTTTSTVPPTPADEIPDEGTSASTSSDDESSSNTIWVILGAVVVLGAAGAAFQLRRKKK